MVQSSGGGGIAFKLNGGMDGGGMAEVARTTSGENEEGKHGFSVFSDNVNTPQKLGKM